MVHTHFRFCYRSFLLSFSPFSPPTSLGCPLVIFIVLPSPCPQQASESSWKARKATSHSLAR